MILSELPIARVVVTGATTWVDGVMIKRVLDEVSTVARRNGGSFRVLTGTAEGADDFARSWASTNETQLFAEDLNPGTYPEPMHRYNDELIALSPNLVLAFKDGFDPKWASPTCVAGTEHLCRVAAEAAIPILLNGTEWLVPLREAYTKEAMTTADDSADDLGLSVVADAAVEGALLQLVQGDITTLPVDVIVNAANSSLLGGGGVDGAIHRAAGPALLDDCRAVVARQGGCKPGDAVITGAGELAAKYVVHTVGPVFNGNDATDTTLGRCYEQSLDLAAEAGATSIAFPNISTGVYRYPKDRARTIAINAVRDWLSANRDTCVERIVFCCFERENTELYTEALTLL